MNTTTEHILSPSEAINAFLNDFPIEPQQRDEMSLTFIFQRSTTSKQLHEAAKRIIELNHLPLEISFYRGPKYSTLLVEYTPIDHS
jgi:hypothetical protein